MLEIQPYLRSSQLSSKEKELLILLRLRMTKTKLNYRTMHADLSCNLCYEDIQQSDSHLLDCDRLIQECGELANNTSVEYEDIFGDESQQVQAIRLFSKVFDTKSRIEDNEHVIN